MFYINKSGCQWRMLPSDFAPWQTVYYYFRKWKLDVVDTLGLPMAINIHEANIPRGFGYVDKTKVRMGLGGCTQTQSPPKKFNVVPKRWIVERTFSWLENYRRLTIDYEFLTETAEAMVTVAFIQILLKRFF